MKNKPKSSTEFISALARELDEKFKANKPRVSKIEGGDTWVAFCIKTDEWLLFSWGASGCCLANGNEIAALKKSSPARTPLVEFLKSQLLKGQLTAARQLQNDRIVEIECSRLVGAGFSNNRFIVFEATTPNGNFFLLDEERAIMELARHASPDVNKYRTLLPGHLYAPPPPFAGTSPHSAYSGENALDAARVLVSALLDGTRDRLLSSVYRLIDRTIKSRVRHLEGLQKQLARREGAEELKLTGQLILENIEKIPPRAESVSLSTWDGAATLKIALDPLRSPAQNAERYFKKYRKAQLDEKRREQIEAELIAMQNAIDELVEQKDLLSAIDDNAELEAAVSDIFSWLDKKDRGENKKNIKSIKNPLPPHLRFDRGNCVVLVGLNARGNRFVTFKQASPNDLWLHAHELPGAHVIVKGEPDEETLMFAATLAARYSKGKNSLRVQVDCTQRRFVRSIPGNAIAHVTYTNPKVITVSL